MISIRRAMDRGHADHGWLNSFHSFSFADYYDPQHHGFRNLRVINEDRVSPGQGFGTHPHRDMEILSYVLEGALEHRDSMGNGSIIRPGDVQRMSAGTGITHSEFNASKVASVHFLQIWIFPKKVGIQPGYEQKTFSREEKLGKLRKVASPDGDDGSVVMNSDASVYAGLFEEGMSHEIAIPRGRYAWVQIARGTVSANEHELSAGDGAAFSGEARVHIRGIAPSEVLVFDLA